MADRYFGCIDFPASALKDEEIKAAVEEEGVRFDEDGPKTMYGNDVTVEGGIFTLSTSEARWGEFEDLESLLQEKDIPFDRDSGAYYDSIPERVIFRPARNGAPVQFLVFLMMNDEPALNVKEIRDLIPQGIEAITAYLDQQFPAYPPLTDWVKED